MRYPTTAQYIESITNPEGLLSTLGNALAVVCGPNNEPLYTSGGFGVVFRVRHGDRDLALKCFTRHQAGRRSAYDEIRTALRNAPSPHIIDFEYLDHEIIVFDADGTPQLYPLLSMEWVDGPTLGSAIDHAAQRADAEQLTRLADGFDRMALWLLGCEFAHGDLKPDNIIVHGSEPTLVLIDYDGIFLPRMSGELAREIGTEGFRHPLRSAMNYDKQIDHYPIALLSLSLRAIALDPTIYTRFHTPEKLIFDPAAILRGNCPAYNHLSGSTLSSDPIYAMLRAEHISIDELTQAIEAHMHAANVTITPDIIFDMTDGVSLYRTAGRYGFIRANSERLTEPIFEQARNFSDGYAAVRLDGCWGFIDMEGRMACEACYDDCGDFSEGLAAVCTGGRWGYISSDFIVVISCRFDDAWPMSYSRGLVRRGDKYGFVSASGNMAIPARLNFAQSFREGVACVMVDGRYGYINRSGRYVVPPEYDYARSVRGGEAYVERNGQGETLHIGVAK